MSNLQSKIYLGLDPGLAKIGLAISHEGKLASPLSTIEAHNLINQISAYLDKYHPDVLVIGQPESGPVADLAIILQSQLAGIFSGPIILHPEDLSSQEAKKKMLAGGMAKERRQKGDHAAAAAIILEDYLDSQENLLQ